MWHEIKAVARKANQRKAAVAYVTKDLIGFREGDVLVADASAAAIKAGETDAKLLATLLRRGVALYSCPGLHAKVLLLDEVAVIGSANMSESSRSTLVEAALMTDAPATAAGVESFLEQLIAQSEKLDGARLSELCKIVVVKRGGRGLGAARKKPRISEIGNRLWLLGVCELIKITAEEDEWIEESKHELAREHETDPDSIDWIRWGRSGRFVAHAKTGDRAIQIWRESKTDKEPVSVHKAVPILRKESRDGITYVFLGEPKGLKKKVSWSAFKRSLKALGIGACGPYSERLLTPDIQAAIDQRWPSIK